MSTLVEPRSLRKSTVELSKEREQFRQIAEKRRSKTQAKSSAKPVKRLTQEQLLKEAKKTEIENLASLDAYTRLEAERKVYKQSKRVIQGPVIRYHSVAMPSISTSDTMTENSRMYSRNFLIFTETQTYPEGFFPSTKHPKPKRHFCSVTGLPARYIDPLTKTPYATPLAFRIIRNKYVREREEKCEKRLIQLSGWLEEKKRLKQEGSH